VPGITASTAANPLTFNMPANSVSATAIFTQNEYALTAIAAPPSGGTFSYDKTAPYHYRDRVTVTATASTGYSFSGWSGADGLNGNEATVVISGNRTITASFSQNSYLLTAAASPSSAAGSIIGSGTYHFNDAVSLNATAAAGWRFSGWSSPDISFSSNTTNPVTFSMPANMATVTGNFVKLTGSLAIQVTPQGRTAGTSQFNIPITVWLHIPRAVFTDAPVYTFNKTTDNQGRINISDIEANIYDVRIKGLTSLRNKQAEVAVTAGGTTSINLGALIEGDYNSDNEIDILDYTGFLPSYGSMINDPSYSTLSDFDSNGQVDDTDYNLLLNNYGQAGAP
jgi:uncharacterized repeat protein (TIGR02543 family)